MSSSATEKSFSNEVIAILVAALIKNNPKAAIDYSFMSKLSNLTMEPTTKSTFEHKFRAVKKRAVDLVAEATQVEANGNKLIEVVAQKSGK